MHGLGHLMGGRGGGQAAAKVQELPDASLGRVGDSATLELAAFPRQLGRPRKHRQQFGGLVAVDGVVVLAAQQRIPNPRDGRLCRCELLNRGGQFRAEPFSGLGLGEPGLHVGAGRLGQVEHLVADGLLGDAVGREIQPQHIQRGADWQRAATHRLRFWPMVNANVSVRATDPSGSRISSSSMQASRRASGSRSAGMCRQEMAHGPWVW